MKNQTLVIKFSGTSVGTTEAMHQAIQIIRDCRAEWSHLVGVTSALSGVTNLLLDSATAAMRGETQPTFQAVQVLKQKHAEMIDSLIADLAKREQVKQDVFHLVADFSNLCQAIAILGEATP